MYEVKVLSEFSAAHHLREYRGKCEELHGHNWKVEAVVSSATLDKAGMLIDFKELKKSLNEILADLDHKDLNNIDYFKKQNPTSEIIAKYIFDNLSKNIAGLKRVSVWETDRSCATYEKG